MPGVFRFDVDLDREAQGLVQRASQWTTETAEKHHGELIANLRALDRELSAAKSTLSLE